MSQSVTSASTLSCPKALATEMWSLPPCHWLS
jgi:hypothetical protein